MEDDQKQRPDSLLPYDIWIDNAMRRVVAQAIEHVAIKGLPGGHHFYITFRTDHPGTDVPARVRAQYPQVMTIVLQHQFWDLGFNRDTKTIQVGLSFGGVPSRLIIPVQAVVEFADPYVRYGIRFESAAAPPANAAPAPAPALAAPDIVPAAEPKDAEPGQVVSLDAFRRRSPQA